MILNIFLKQKIICHPHRHTQSVVSLCFVPAALWKEVEHMLVVLWQQDRTASSHRMWTQASQSLQPFQHGPHFLFTKTTVHFLLPVYSLINQSQTNPVISSEQGYRWLKNIDPFTHQAYMIFAEHKERFLLMNQYEKICYEW